MSAFKILQYPRRRVLHLNMKGYCQTAVHGQLERERERRRFKSNALAARTVTYFLNYGEADDRVTTPSAWFHTEGGDLEFGVWKTRINGSADHGLHSESGLGFRQLLVAFNCSFPHFSALGGKNNSLSIVNF